MNQQSQPPVPPTPSAPAAAPDAHYHMPPTNPGQTTGIIGLILPFFGLSLVGLVLSIVSTAQSAKVRAPKTLGIIGIVANVIGIVVTVFLLFVIVIFASHSNLEQRTDDTQTRTAATLVRKQAEVYHASEGRYPASMRELVLTIETPLPDARLIEGTPVTTKEVGYQPCGPNGARVQYLLSSSIVPTSLYLGTGSAETC